MLWIDGWINEGGIPIILSPFHGGGFMSEEFAFRAVRQILSIVDTGFDLDLPLQGHISDQIWSLVII